MDYSQSAAGVSQALGSLPSRGLVKECTLIVSLYRPARVTIARHVTVHVDPRVFAKRREKSLNITFHKEGNHSNRGENWMVFVRKIHRWVIKALCASRAKHIREQSWSCQASRNFQAENHCSWSGNGEYTGWDLAGEHQRLNTHELKLLLEVDCFPFTRQQLNKSVWCPEGVLVFFFVFPSLFA